jgi:hypothetical protein
MADELETTAIDETVQSDTVINFAGMFKAFEAVTEKDWRYDRNASLGASEVFGCIRQAYFKKFGYEPDDDHEDDWGAAKRGDIIENNFAVPAVQAILPKGAELIYAGEDQDTLRIRRLSATPDGLAINLARDALAQLGIPDIESDCVVTEFKSFDPRAHIKEEKAIHRGQVQVQMGLIHELTDYKPMYAIIFYFNASILSDIRPYVVKFDPKVYQTAKDRSELVYATNEPADLPAEGKIDDACRLCSFTEECSIAQGLATPRNERRVDNTEVLDRVAELAKFYKDRKAAEKEASQQAGETAQEIKDLLRKHDTKKIVAQDGTSVSVSWCKGKKTLDRLAMEDAGIDTTKFEKEGNGYDRLNVSLGK